MKIENNSIRIRDFTKADLPLMLKWPTNDRVLEFYKGRNVKFTMDTLSRTFLEEIPDGFRMIIEYKEQPVGYGQAYQLPASFLTRIKTITEQYAPMKKQDSES